MESGHKQQIPFYLIEFNNKLSVIPPSNSHVVCGVHVTQSSLRDLYVFTVYTNYFDIEYLVIWRGFQEY